MYSRFFPKKKVSKMESRILDFRHFDGTNEYLMKIHDSSELEWIREDAVPAGLDEEMFIVRKRRGDIAKRRVFGKCQSDVKSRKLFLARNKAGSDRSGSEASSSSDDLEMTTAMTAIRSGGKSGDLCSFGGLARPNGRQTEIMSSLSLSVGCRSLLPQFLHSPDEIRLNEMFSKLLFEDASCLLSESMKHFIDLLWTSVIASPVCPDREKALETLYLLVRSKDSMISCNLLEEFVSETTLQISDAFNRNIFVLLARFCDIFIENRLHGGVSKMLNGSATIHKPAFTTNMLLMQQSEPFAYTSSTELDEAGIINLVSEIYRLRNPEKLADVPGIIEKYKFQLTNLFGILMKKYEISYPDLVGENGPVFLNIAEKKIILGPKLFELFLLYEPSRLCDLDEILNYWVEKPTSEVAKYIETLEAGYGRIWRPIVPDSPIPETPYTQLVCDAFALGNPDYQRGQIAELLARYSGKENLLYLAVCDKYGVKVNESAFKAAEVERTANQTARKRAQIRAVLEQIYSVHNPSKSGEIAKLLEKFQPLELFNLIVKKYNIGIIEKITYLQEIFEDFSIASLPPLLSIHSRALAFIVALEGANFGDGGIIQSGIPSSFLRPLGNPFESGENFDAVESIIRAKTSLDTESGLRELIASRVARFGPSCRVTAQEPEYYDMDAFAATETPGRASCVLAIQGADSGGSAIIQCLTDEPSIRMHTIISSKSLIGFVGEFRVFKSNPELYCSRFTLWASVDVSVHEKLLVELVCWPKWLKQTCVYLDRHTQTVSITGSAMHPTAYKQGVAFLTQHLAAPYLSFFIPKRLILGPAGAPVLSPQVYEWSDASFHESLDDVGEEDWVTEIARPIRLSRTEMRDSYLEGQLCLNCDDVTHKPTECLFARKVCWNCHGSHSGSACIYPCRFCKGKHAWGVLECVKKGAKRVSEWQKSRSFGEQKNLSVLADDLPKIVSAEARAAGLQSLQAMGVDLELLGVGVGEGGGRLTTPPPSATPLPDSRYVERVFLDDLLDRSLIGRDILKVILAQKGVAIKQIEQRENCKLQFRGTSAKDVFANKTDVRFQVVILCESYKCALRVKKFLHEMIATVQTGLMEGKIPLPPIVEGFSYLEPIPQLADDLFQFDYLHNFQAGSSCMEIDLKKHFEFTGDLRHWLHRQAIQVELGDDANVQIPPAGKIDTIIGRKIVNAADKTVEFYNKFVELVEPNNGTYWFEPFELEPVGILSISEFVCGTEAYESGQVVRLSRWGIEHFSRLISAATSQTDEQIITTLECVKGVVRMTAKNNKLLMYLKHPWTLSSASGTVAHDVPEEFCEDLRLTANALRACGRLGTLRDDNLLNSDPEVIRKHIVNLKSVATIKPGDSLIERLDSVPEIELPYVGYIIDWVTPSEVKEYLSSRVVTPELVASPVASPADDPMDDVVPDAVATHVEDLHALSVAQLRDKLRTKNLPLTGRKIDLIERIEADVRGGVPKPVCVYKCRVELPKALMKWTDIVNNLAGPGGSHFNHIRQQCPTATLVCLGSPSEALVGEARLHVQLTATESTDYRKAKVLVEDLVRAVVDVGADACLADVAPTERVAALKEVKVISITEPEI